MKTPHKHAELIIAWVHDQSIKLEFKRPLPGAEWTFWYSSLTPITNPEYQWRIKPEPKPDLNFYYHVDNETHLPTFPTESFHLNLKLTFDGETRKLKSSEVIS